MLLSPSEEIQWRNGNSTINSKTIIKSSLYILRGCFWVKECKHETNSRVNFNLKNDEDDD